jgi:hypothetical protein
MRTRLPRRAAPLLCLVVVVVALCLCVAVSSRVGVGGSVAPARDARRLLPLLLWRDRGVGGFVAVADEPEMLGAGGMPATAPQRNSLCSVSLSPAGSNGRHTYEYDWWTSCSGRRATAYGTPLVTVAYDFSYQAFHQMGYVTRCMHPFHSSICQRLDLGWDVAAGGHRARCWTERESGTEGL